MTTLTDVLVGIVHLLPVREEATLNNWLQVIENARPQLDKLIVDVIPAVETVSTAVADVANVVKGL